MALDKSTLSEILKKHGLSIGEDVAVLAVKSILTALPEILEATENKFDDLLIPVLDVVQEPILKLIDKIDGEVG